MRNIILLTMLAGGVYGAWWLHSKGGFMSLPGNNGGSSGGGMPRGIRNNNPGNIRWSPSNPWLGQLGQDAQGFVIFDTPEHGIRAMNRTLNSYDRAGYRNAQQIVARWDQGVNSPNIDMVALPQHTRNYIAFVANRLGVNDQLPLDGRHRSALVKAIIHFENGSNPYSDSLVAKALAMA